ncbi:MAG: CHAT domain-containing protein [Bryobacteraceae bacterium]|jgi:hypothetical protein|nr:CHAT domain-containing protein [Bryobacteraceae bacterium]
MKAAKYVDCTLILENEKTLSLVYYDEDGTRCSEKGELGSDPVVRLTVKRLNEWVNFGLKQQEASRGKENPVTVDDLRVIGLNLYRILFSDRKIQDTFHDVYRRFQAAYKEQTEQSGEGLRLRLRIVFEKAAESLGRLPWEFLFVPDADNPERGFFFAGERTELILTRYVPVSDLVKKLSPPAPSRLKILVAVSEPSGLGAVDESEFQRLLAQIREITREEVPVLRGADCTYQKLGKTLDACRPHIFHYIGHGEEGRLALVKSPEDPDYDEGEGERPVRWVTSEQFRKLFGVAKPRLVFLHACKGAAASSQDAFNSCARQLVYADIPAVVAMQYSISSHDANLFAKTFYEELGRGRDVDEAVKAGRLALGGKVWPFWEHPRFGTPVVYLQTDKPIVLPLPDEQESREAAARTSPAPAGGSRVAVPAPAVAASPRPGSSEAAPWPGGPEPPTGFEG